MNSWLCLYRALLLGCCLGIVWGFLRPVRPRWLSDLFFLGALWWVWVYLIFGLCGADPRLAYTLTLLGGCFLWDFAFGSTLQPLFSGFWQGFFRFFDTISTPIRFLCKKLRVFGKFLFAMGYNKT